jgi:hypothetical protein
VAAEPRGGDTGCGIAGAVTGVCAKSIDAVGSCDLSQCRQVRTPASSRDTSAQSEACRVWLSVMGCNTACSLRSGGQRADGDIWRGQLNRGATDFKICPARESFAAGLYQRILWHFQTGRHGGPTSRRPRQSCSPSSKKWNNSAQRYGARAAGAAKHWSAQEIAPHAVAAVISILTCSMAKNWLLRGGFHSSSVYDLFARCIAPDRRDSGAPESASEPPTSSVSRIGSTSSTGDDERALGVVSAGPPTVITAELADRLPWSIVSLFRLKLTIKNLLLNLSPCTTQAICLAHSLWRTFQQCKGPGR